MKKLYFLRHGQTEMNVSGHYAGLTETPLTAEGRNQATLAGQAAKGLGIDLIVSSPLSRAHNTAEIIAQEIGYPLDKILINPLLIERNGGELEGKPFDRFGTNYDDVVGAEKDDVLVARAQAALDWINSLKADHILIVSHGSFGRALRSLIKTEYPMSHPERINNAELLCWIEEN